MIALITASFYCSPLEALTCSETPSARRSVAITALLTAMLGLSGCRAAPPAAAQIGTDAGSVAHCVANLWGADGFEVWVTPAQAGWRVAAFGMPPSLRAAGRVPPRMAAEIIARPDGSVVARLLHAQALLGGQREAARVAGCATSPEGVAHGS